MGECAYSPFELGFGKVVDLRDKEKQCRYYVNKFLCTSLSMFEYEGLPDSIPSSDFETILQTCGFGVGIEKEGKRYVLVGNLGGTPYSPYLRPTWCTIANVALNISQTFHFNEDSILIRNDSRWEGLLPMFNRYATLMLENDISLWLADILARVPYSVVAGDDSSKLAAEQFFKDVIAGKLGAIGDDDFLKNINSISTGSEDTIINLIEYHQYLNAGWQNEIGLNANYNMKRERIQNSEAQMNLDILLPRCDDMLKCRKEDLEKFNEFFGEKVKVDFSSSWKYRREEMQRALEEGQKITYVDVYDDGEKKKEISEEKDDAEEKAD